MVAKRSGAEVWTMSRDKKKADEELVYNLMDFIRNLVSGLSVDGRFLLTKGILELLKPEIDELKRRGTWQ